MPHWPHKVVFHLDTSIIFLKKNATNCFLQTSPISNQLKVVSPTSIIFLKENATDCFLRLFLSSFNRRSLSSLAASHLRIVDADMHRRVATSHRRHASSSKSGGGSFLVAYFNTLTNWLRLWYNRQFGNCSKKELDE